ncbi:MAG: hypothetical protein H6Q90_2119 [Deltaproteobacteria bacterium]|nr:hypothetical protein [Deltaproteobacteria bacterium]
MHPAVVLAGMTGGDLDEDHERALESFEPEEGVRDEVAPGVGAVRADEALAAERVTPEQRADTLTGERDEGDVLRTRTALLDGWQRVARCGQRRGGPELRIVRSRLAKPPLSAQSRVPSRGCARLATVQQRGGSAFGGPLLVLRL